MRLIEILKGSLFFRLPIQLTQTGSDRLTEKETKAE